MCVYMSVCLLASYESCCQIPSISSACFSANRTATAHACLIYLFRTTRYQTFQKKKKSTKHSRKTESDIQESSNPVRVREMEYSPDLRWRLYKSDQAPHKADCTRMQLCNLNFITTHICSSLVCDLAQPPRCFGIWLHPLDSSFWLLVLLLSGAFNLASAPIILALWSSTRSLGSLPSHRLPEIRIWPHPLFEAICIPPTYAQVL